MKKEHKYARFGLIALTALGSIGLEKPTKENFHKRSIPEHSHPLRFDTESTQSPGPVPIPSRPILKRENLLRLELESTAEPNNQLITPLSMPVVVNRLYETEEFINEQKELIAKENEPKYTEVDWDSLNLIDKENVKNWEDLILKHANYFDVPPKIIAVIIDTESHGRTDGDWKELEGDGAGLMGVMPNDKDNSFPKRPDRDTLINNHDVNISYGTAILDEINANENQGDGSWFKTFLWYNAGLQDKLKYAIPYAKHVYSKLGWKKNKEDLATLMVINKEAHDPPNKED